MKTGNTWKQPIPTDLDVVFGDNHVSRFIYIECLLHARNESKTISLNGEIVVLERGQCFITVDHLANSLNRNRKTIRTHLNLLTGLYNRMDITRHRFGFVVTIHNYDEIVKLDTRTDIKTDNRGTSERTSEGHKQDSKNDKNDITYMRKEPVLKKTPEEQALYKGLIAYCAEKGGRVKFTNWGKQIKCLETVLQAGHTPDQIRYVIDFMASEDYWQKATFDMSNVYNNFDKYINKFVPIKKGGAYVKPS